MSKAVSILISLVFLVNVNLSSVLRKNGLGVDETSGIFGIMETLRFSADLLANLISATVGFPFFLGIGMLKKLNG